MGRTIFQSLRAGNGKYGQVTGTTATPSAVALRLIPTLSWPVTRLSAAACWFRHSLLTQHGAMVAAQIIKEKQQFQRVVVSRDEALQMFQENRFKVEILSGLPQDATITLYRHPLAAHTAPTTCTPAHGTLCNALHGMHACMSNVCMHLQHAPEAGFCLSRQCQHAWSCMTLSPLSGSF